MERVLTEKLAVQKYQAILHLASGHSIEYTAGLVGVSISELDDWLKNDRYFQGLLREECLVTVTNPDDLSPTVAKIIGYEIRKKPSMMFLVFFWLLFGIGMGSYSHRYVENRNLELINIFVKDIAEFVLFWIVFTAIMHSLRVLKDEASGNRSYSNSKSDELFWFFRLLKNIIIGMIAGFQIGLIFALNIGLVALKSWWDGQVAGLSSSILIALLIFAAIFLLFKIPAVNKGNQDFEASIDEFLFWLQTR